MENTRKESIGLAATCAIFATFALAMGATAINPAMQSMIQYWAPQGVSINSVRLMNTIPSLAVVVSTIFSGMVVGRRISYKAMAAIGFALFAFFGCLPAVMSSNFTLILVSRAIVGLGIGLVAPLGNTLVMQFFDKNRAAAFIGYGSVVKNIINIIMVWAAGILCIIGWQLTFWVYAIGIVGLIIVLFFMPEPAKAAAPQGTAAKPKRHLDSFVAITAITFFLTMLVAFPVQMNVSTWLDMLGAGTASDAGIVLSVYTLFGMIASLIFGVMFKRFGRYTIPVGYLVGGIGMLLIRFGGSLVPIACGMALAGFGFMFLTPAFFSFIGQRLDPSSRAFAISLSLAALNIGAFLATYYLMGLQAIFGDSYWAVSFLLPAIVYFVLGAIFLVYNPMKGHQESAPREKSAERTVASDNRDCA